MGSFLVGVLLGIVVGIALTIWMIENNDDNFWNW